MEYIDIIFAKELPFKGSGLADLIKEGTARIGGDEFVVLAVKNTDVNGNIPTTRLQKNLDEHNAKGSRGYQLSISVGTTQFDPEQPLSVDELLDRADALMYEQKRGKQK